MGNIAKAISEFTPPKPGYECGMCRALAMVEPEDRAAIEAELAKDKNDRSRVTDGALAKIMTDAGFFVHRMTVMRHRRKECRTQ